MITLLFTHFFFVAIDVPEGTAYLFQGALRLRMRVTLYDARSATAFRWLQSLLFRQASGSAA